MGEYLYKSIVFIIVRSAGLGLGRPEVKPSTPRPLPVRLKELAGKSRWMNWEPVSLAEDAPSEGRRSRLAGRFPVMRLLRLDGSEAKSSGLWAA